MREGSNDVRDFLLKIRAKMEKERKIKEWLQETLDNFLPWLIQVQYVATLPVHVK